MVGNITGKDEDEILYPLLSPPGGDLFQTYLRWGTGRLNRDGGVIREGKHISFTEHGR